MLLLHGFFESFDHKNEPLFIWVFFSPVYKWLTHYCVILRGSQSNNGVNQPKQSCPALNEQTVGIQKHLSFKKQNAYIVDC